jgi:hypothetical protein
LLSYINSLSPLQVKNGIHLYAEPKRDSANFATIIAVNAARNTVVALKTASPEIGDSAVADITNSLSQSPEGPLVVTYPSPWNTMLSPCQLLTAADFARYTGTPASALAGDTLALTDVGDGQMKRSCQRLEVERYNGGEISESNVTVRLAKTSKEAEEYLAGVKANERDAITIEPVSSAIEGVDESYVRIEGAQKAYQFEMRIGKAFVAVTVKPEIKQESSGEAYAARMLPVAKQVAARFKQLHSQE